MDTRGVELTIRIGQDMQMYHTIRWKQIDMSTADQLIWIFSNNAGTPNKTFSVAAGHAVVVKTG